MAARAATAAKPKARKTASAKPKKASTAKKSEAAAESESATATLEKPVKRRRKVETRTRIYWAVFNQDLKRVAVFEFGQKAEAEKRAAALMEKSGNHHFIQKIKAAVPV